jgi:uncharacterized membrane protein YhaH (DUF805 family)
MSENAHSMTAQTSLVLPRLILANGTVEALKWIALALMTLDHTNKYLFHDSMPALFDIGRLTLPLFGFVLAYNLARPDTLGKGIYPRVLKRLVLYGVIAEIPFIGLGGIAWGWYPLNIMASLFFAVSIIYLIEIGGMSRYALAVIIFILGGAVVEFWWPGVALCVAAWCYCKKPGWLVLIAWIVSIAALYIINRNLWALATFPVIFAAPYIRLNMPRSSRIFYVYYPAHLAVLWLFAQKA